MYAFAKSVFLHLLPPSGPIFAIAIGLMLLRQRPKLGRTIAIAGTAVLWLASAPLVVSWLVAVFGASRPVDLSEAKSAQAIVVLGAGVRRNATEYGTEDISPLTLERIRYGAVLARTTGLPILVAGGVPPRARQSEARLMQRALVDEFGIEPRWAEDKSTNTRENAVNSAALLRRAGAERIVLVTHAFDAPRARRQFEREGIKVVSAPTRVPSVAWELRGLLPNPAALTDSFFLGYETLARLADALLPGR